MGGGTGGPLVHRAPGPMSTVTAPSNPDRQTDKAEERERERERGQIMGTEVTVDGNVFGHLKEKDLPTAIQFL